jgi:hypothetical protein
MSWKMAYLHTASMPTPHHNPRQPAAHLLCCLSLALLTTAAEAAAVTEWRDGGFESFTRGPSAVSLARDGWEVQKTGRAAIQPKLEVTGIEDAAQAHSGKRCVALSIPADTVGFEFVTIGQRVSLTADSDYEASVWVRWPDGPERAPPEASATSGHRSAIVSFWARHRDGTGDFAGRDEWLFDNQWHQLTFRFRATDPKQPTLVYVSLLPNQKPSATTVLVDDFELQASPATPSTDARGARVNDPDFSAQKPGAISPPWYFANIGGSGIRGEMTAENDGHLFRMSMDRKTTNYESAQLWQHLDLLPGARYHIAARLRWDNYTAEAPAPIVNYGIYHEPTRTWYGPVDQVLEKTGDWREYRFTHIPPMAGPWKIYIQLNGWGNFGNGVTVSLDELTCDAAPLPPAAD